VVGLWGRKAKLDDLLRDQDRIEVYRPLRVDPKVARRERFVKQGARGAGLFAQKRQGAKAGY
jgi:putative ubiquitin-RnfH superfamily antitoxin RatB of RatAB toxin-antitoxin module